MGFHDEEGYVFRDRYPEREDVYRLFDESSDEARRKLACRLNLSYGRHARERFDLFLGPVGAPLLVFVHGGYWQSLSKERFSFVAQAFVERGFSVALPNYPLATAVSLASIVNSVRLSVPAIFAELRNAGHAPPFWIASGHSAGGHLAAMLAITDWHGFGLPLAGCAPISGIFDLEPLIATSLNAALRLDAQEAARLSPAKMPIHGGRLLAFVGADETPAFRSQSEVYREHWLRNGGVGECIQLSNRNHYTILLDLLEERSEIAGNILSWAQGFRGEGKAGDRR